MCFLYLHVQNDLIVARKVVVDMQVLDVDLPITVVVKVVQTDPGLKGDTAQGFPSPLPLFSFSYPSKI